MVIMVQCGPSVAANSSDKDKSEQSKEHLKNK